VEQKTSSSPQEEDSPKEEMNIMSEGYPNQPKAKTIRTARRVRDFVTMADERQFFPSDKKKPNNPI